MRLFFSKKTHTNYLIYFAVARVSRQNWMEMLIMKFVSPKTFWYFTTTQTGIASTQTGYNDYDNHLPRSLKWFIWKMPKLEVKTTQANYGACLAIVDSNRWAKSECFSKNLDRSSVRIQVQHPKHELQTNI